LGIRWRDVAAPCLLGAALRLYRLPTQILVDDEWHMVHKLREGAGLASLVGDFGSNDHSIGLSLCAWTMARVTTLNETMLRLPSLVAGLVLIALVPALLARFVGRGTAIVTAWLLAVSPLLCFFSRLARPYAITTLLASVAVLAFHRWFLTGSRRAATTWVVTTTLAPLFHLPALPAVLAPCALRIVARGLPLPASAPSPRRIARLVLVTLGALGLVLAVPTLRSAATVAARLQTDHPGPATLPILLELLAGTGHPIGVALVAVFAMVGAVALARRDQLLLRLFVLAIAAQVTAVIASGAAASHVPIVAARYLAVVLPFLWVFPAAGCQALARRLGLRSAQVVGAGAALALVAIGPLGWIDGVPNDFTNHISYQADYVPDRYFERFRPYDVSAFYEDLAARPPGSVTIVEAPWYFYFHPFAYTQRVHRQRVLIGFVDEEARPVRSGEVARNDPVIRLRNAVHLGDRETLKDRRVDFVILHRDLLQEIEWPHGVSERPIDVTSWEDRYRAWFGAPVFTDAHLVVFAVR
jgi:hypothetical protein